METKKVHIKKPYRDWSPAQHTVFKDLALAEEIHIKGYKILPIINRVDIQKLKDLYDQLHTIKSKNGAMFYSLYSKDHEYRKLINQTIKEILSPTFDAHFVNYKNVVNIFINKLSGPESGFYTHQDTTALDEYEFSPLSVWIPLQDVDLKNGTLGVIEKSHWFFSPFRGITIPFPFTSINSTIREYLTPLSIKAGEALIFDPRIVHNSFPNLSGKDRIVVLSGIFPSQSKFITCYKEIAPESKIELIEQDDSYILENDNFYYDCHVRPTSGKLMKIVENDFPNMTADEFEELCYLNHIQKAPNTEDYLSNCSFIAEPDGININTSNSCEINSPTAFETLKTKFIKNLFFWQLRK